MLLLILSRDLELKFLSHSEATPGFRPQLDAIGQTIEVSRSLIEADPDLPALS
jgi:hypothetical protein